MGYSSTSEWPTIFHTNVLTNSAQVVGTSGQEVYISGIYFEGGAALESIIFESSDGNATEHWRFGVDAGVSDFWPMSFKAPGGLQVRTADAAGDVGLSVLYYTGD